MPISSADLLNAMKTGVDMHFPAETSKARFAVGDSIRVLNNSPAGHTRAPRYVRGKIGKIVGDMGVFQFADTIAAGTDPNPQHCYTVVFSTKALWGRNAEISTDSVYLDLAEAYIEHA
jgi:nitrile hydratase